MWNSRYERAFRGVREKMLRDSGEILFDNTGEVEYHRKWVRRAYRRVLLLLPLVLLGFLTFEYLYLKTDLVLSLGGRLIFNAFLSLFIFVYLILLMKYHLCFQMIRHGLFGVIITEKKLIINYHTINRFDLSSIMSVEIDGKRGRLTVNLRMEGTYRSIRKRFDLKIVRDIDLFVRTLRKLGVEVTVGSGAEV